MPACCTEHTPKTQTTTNNTCQNPVLVQVTRGGIVESQHRGRYIIVDVAGNVRDEVGDCNTPTYPRSSAKIFQALPMILSNAHKHYNLTDAEIAITCASHLGQPEHTKTVNSILTKAGLSIDDLECGTHAPTHRKSADTIIKNRDTFTPLHNNCSGKHAGMLLYAKKMGWDTNGYIHPEHPVQQSICQHLGDICGYNMDTSATDRDGCSVPTWAMPLKNLAFGFACVADPHSTLPPAVAQAIKTLTDAVSKHPFMVGGSNQCCSDIMNTLGKKAFVKGGAEGVYLASLPEYGIGIAIKVDDGHGRANGVILLRILEKVGVLTPEHKQHLLQHYHPPVTNWNKYTVGQIQPAF